MGAKGGVLREFSLLAPLFFFLPTCQAVTDGAKHGTSAVTAKTTKLLNVNMRETNHRNQTDTLPRCLPGS